MKKSAPAPAKSDSASRRAIDEPEKCTSGLLNKTAAIKEYAITRGE